MIDLESTDGEKTMNEEFWKWVVGLPQTDNPRGDFVIDAKEVMRIGGWRKCNESISNGCLEAIEVYGELIKEYKTGEL